MNDEPYRSYPLPPAPPSARHPTGGAGAGSSARSVTALAVVLLASVALAAATGGAVAGGAVAWWALRQVEPASAVSVPLRSSQAQPAVARDVELREEELALAAVRATRPAVVTVWNVGYVQRSVFARPELRVIGEGSGVIFDPRGYIATNAHVVKGAQAIGVVLLDGRRVDAELVGLHDAYDVAVLRIQGELPGVARLADSSTLEPGMRVMAIGSPLGTQFQNTVTTGIIAGLNRRVTERYYNWFTREPVVLDLNEAPLIQTDAAINTGNSGGPLIDLRGEVVALNTLIVRRDAGTTVEGLGFAVPSNVVRALADEWVDGIRRGWLGLEHETLDPVVARERGLQRGSGALVSRVWAGSPAEGAGLRPGDVVTAVGGVQLDVDHALAEQLWRFRAGDRVTLGVERGDEALQVEVELIADPRPRS